jgi:hypothetical protein
MWSREMLSRGLGALECALGVALLYQGCRSAIFVDDGMASMAGTFMVVSALFAFIVPGGLLWLRSPLRWLAQLPLVVMLTWLGLSAALRALGH